MNTFSIYVLLVIMFLGLSKSLSLSEKGTIYIRNKNFITNYFTGNPISIILVDSFNTGFLIKTYYQKYKIIHTLKPPQIVSVRVSEDFHKENVNNIGMSIFRRDEKKGIEDLIPMPPGALFIGRPSFGTWKKGESGELIWSFYRGYKHFPKILGWNDYNVSFRFFKRMKFHQDNQRPFYGPNTEFGTTGSITKKAFPEYFHKEKSTSRPISHFMRKFLKTNLNWEER